MEQREPSYTVGGNVNWCSHYGKQYGGSLKRKKEKQSYQYDPAIPLLGICPDKALNPIDTGTPMFIAALFTIAKTLTQTKCLLTDEWVKKMWYK